jgi:hypothetical protein
LEVLDERRVGLFETRPNGVAGRGYVDVEVVFPGSS